MMRKIHDKLLQRLLKGDLIHLLEYIKSDTELRLEVRPRGDAFVYYKKGKALEIKGLKVDEKYGDTPDTELAKSEPKKYFELMKKSMDNWFEKNSKKEFDSQQKIAQSNQDKDDRFLILDMEYNFSRKRVKDKKIKQAGFDLLGIERDTGSIVFFELKRGKGALNGKSGVKDHIKDFNLYIHEHPERHIFREDLIGNIKNIIYDKNQLGLLDNFKLTYNLEKSDIKFIFVLHPDNEDDIHLLQNMINDEFELIVIDEAYKLK